MRNLQIGRIACAATCVVALYGCGGSISGSIGQASTPEGLFLGTTDTNRRTVEFVLNTGTYYIFYSVISEPGTISGVIEGTVSQGSGSYTSDNAVDVNLDGLGVMPAAITGSYSTAQSLSGTVTYALSSDTVNFSELYYPAGYQATPSLSVLAGTYSGKGGTSNGGESQVLSISAAGAVTGSGADGCAYTGTAQALTKGNGYSISITFGAAPCAYPYAAATGLAYLDNVSNVVYIAAMLPKATDGFVFSGNS